MKLGKKIHLARALVVVFAGLALWPLSGAAQVFEVIHPEVDEGGFELESLNGVTLDSLEDGEERSAHEIAIGYGLTDFWKTKLAIEIVKPEGENGEYEAFEWENVFLLPFGEGHGAHGSHGHGSHDHGSHDHDEGPFFALEAIGIFAALEVPNEGGFDSGAVEVGPIAEFAIGPLQTIANFFVGIPFDDDENTGIAYAVQVRYPVWEQVGIGFESFGEVENVFESDTEDGHFIGPAIFTEFDLGRNRILEPRAAVLFGLSDNTPDAVLSVNLELKF